jgi:hypothetical protein
MRLGKLVGYIGFIFLFVTVALSDDRTLRVGFQSLTGNPPSGATVEVTAGSVTNQDVSSISFYVEYSDDLVSWTPLHSFDLSGTNTEPTIASCLTVGQTALFVDEHGSQHRFYRAVESQ